MYESMIESLNESLNESMNESMTESMAESMTESMAESTLTDPGLRISGSALTDLRLLRLPFAIGVPWPGLLHRICRV